MIGGAAAATVGAGLPAIAMSLLLPLLEAHIAWQGTASEST